MELLMPTSVVDLFAEKFQGRPLRKASASKTRKVKKHSKKKQASKNRSPEFNEFVWLKKYLTRKVIFTIFILSATIMAPFYLSESDIMPIDKIRIQGAFKQLDTARVKTQLEHYLGQGFFSVDIQSMQQEIKQQAWIKSVSVQRVWPGELNVNIVEKTAFARWDKQHLLSTDATVFKADSEAFSQLPLISGFIGDRAELLLRYRLLQQRFAALGLHLNEMRQDSKGALFLRLRNNLLVKLGSEQIERKINQLLAIFPVVIKPEIDAVQAIDFRYSNGFAISWKDDKQHSQEKQLKRGRKHV